LISGEDVHPKMFGMNGRFNVEDKSHPYTTLKEDLTLLVYEQIILETLDNNNKLRFDQLNAIVVSL